MEHEEVVLESDNKFSLTGWPYSVEPGDEPKREVVDKPSHYTQGGIECIDAIQSALTDDEFRGYCKGQAIAYLWRERFKGGDTDIAKAGWYCRRLAK